MLGAIKGDGAQGGGSLFRLLSRRWKPLARVKRPRTSLPLALGAEENTGARPSAWIGAKRPPPAPVVRPKGNAKRSGSTWNPWLWVK
jgi:hypothetical protein